MYPDSTLMKAKEDFQMECMRSLDADLKNMNTSIIAMAYQLKEVANQLKILNEENKKHH